MADANMQNFDNRMRKIMSHHERLSRGYVTTLTDDGLIVARPQPRGMARLPWRFLLLMLVAAMGFKVLLFAQIGPESYQARVATLAAGNQLEQVGAYVMTADPVTVWLATQLNTLRP